MGIVVAVKKHPFRVVMTGAPCSGKTSAVLGLPDLLRARGLRTVVVPETASHLLESGAFGRTTPEDFLALQTAILRMQLLTEELILSAGEADVVLYDRGALDGAAFVDDALWRKICRRCKVTTSSLLARYDMVLLMELPPQSLYTRHNNCTRIEEYAQAQHQHERLLHRWQAHPNLLRIPAMRTMHERLEAMAERIAAK